MKIEFAGSFGIIAAIMVIISEPMLATPFNVFAVIYELEK